MDSAMARLVRVRVIFTMHIVMLKIYDIFILTNIVRIVTFKILLYCVN